METKNSFFVKILIIMEAFFYKTRFHKTWAFFRDRVKSSRASKKEPRTIHLNWEDWRVRSYPMNRERKVRKASVAGTIAMVAAYRRN